MLLPDIYLPEIQLSNEAKRRIIFTIFDSFNLEIEDGLHQN
jgi:hypothetical protein